MNAMEKNRLSKEAEMQVKALKRINSWKNIALILSAVGVVLAYNGISDGRSLVLGILGIIIIVAGALCAILLNLGLKNGRRNVEKILHVLDKGAGI